MCGRDIQSKERRAGRTQANERARLVFVSSFPLHWRETTLAWMNLRARLLLVSLLLIVPAAAAQDLHPYNVRWNTPSKDSLDSMPLAGRLGAGANVWVQDGSIWLYLGHNGAYDERGRL